jgi:hypothetical protein
MMLLYCPPVLLAIALIVFIALTFNNTSSVPEPQGAILKTPGETEFQELYDTIGAHIEASIIDLRPKFVRAAFHDGMWFNLLTIK